MLKMRYVKLLIRSSCLQSNAEKAKEARSWNWTWEIYISCLCSFNLVELSYNKQIIWFQSVDSILLVFFDERLVTVNNKIPSLMVLPNLETFGKIRRTRWSSTYLLQLSLLLLISKSLASSYGQTAINSGLCVDLSNVLDNFHPIDWENTKQEIVSYLPFEAEVLVCADGGDWGIYLKICLNHSSQPLSKISYSSLSQTVYSIQIQHFVREDIIVWRPRVLQVRNNFISQKLDFVKWTSKTFYTADPLMKRRFNISKFLNNIITSFLMLNDLKYGYTLDRRTLIWVCKANFIVISGNENYVAVFLEDLDK